MTAPAGPAVTPPVTTEPPGRLPPYQEPLLAVLAGVAAGLLVVWLHHPRVGLLVVTGALGLATVLRAVLSPRRAGLLVVRGRAIDLTALAALTAGVLALALAVPFPPPGA